jgi:hypothetical protein
MEFEEGTVGLSAKRGTDHGTSVEQNVVEQQRKPWITKHLNH